MMKQTIAAITLAAVLPFSALAQNQVPGQHFIENWDLDEDGQITLAEATQKRDDLFYMFDQDENGTLDSAEYDLFDETRQADMQANAGGHKKGPMKGVNQGLMRDYNDTDGNGDVSKQEFLNHTPDWFVQLDRNEDGVITTADFGGRGQ